MRVIITVFFLLVNSQIIFSQPTMVWHKLYGGTEDDKCQIALKDSHDNFYLIGKSLSHNRDVKDNHGNVDIWIVATDSDGKLLWSRSIGGSDKEALVNAKNVNDTLKIKILSESYDGDVERKYDSKAWNHVLNIEFTLSLSGEVLKRKDGNLQGLIDIENHSDAYYYHRNNRTFTDIKGVIGNDTAIKFSEKYQDLHLYYPDTIKLLLEEEEYITTIKKTIDGNFLGIGSKAMDHQTGSYQKHSADFLIIKFTGKGKIIWKKTFGGSENDAAVDFVESNNSYIITGITNSRDGDLKDPKSNMYHQTEWVIKIDLSGNLIWEKTFINGGEANVRSIFKTSDNQYVICGSYTDSNSGNLTVPNRSYYYSIIKFKE